jgi:NAD(P)-dependent dehydrogenase (short-subunit alcohol dehydrogenase family)
VEHLDGKVAVVTGGGGGIGIALAEAFAGAGMRLVLADVEVGALERAASGLREQGAEVLAVVTDVADAASVDELAAATFERFGTAHVVCNNAGVGGIPHEAWAGPLADWEWVVGINLMGVVHGIRAFGPRLLDQDEGAIVNTASLAALVCIPFLSPYTATKHAVLGLTEALAHELAMRGSRVSAHVLCPAFLQSGIAASERNWPEDRLGPTPEFDTEGVAGLIGALVDAGLPPSELAALTVDAVRTGRFYVTTHPDETAAAVAGLAAAVDGAAPRNPLG